LKPAIVIAVGAFVIGYLAGQVLPWRVALAPSGTAPVPDVAGASAVRAPVPREFGEHGFAQQAPAASDTGTLAAFEQSLWAGRLAEAAALREQLLDRARALSAGGAGSGGLELVQALIAIDPFDVELLLVESELIQQQGRLLDAMEPLLTLLAQSNEAALRAVAREQLRLLVNVHESQLATRQDLPGLIRFFEGLTLRDAGYDGHRLSLARWLLRDGRVDAAERVVREMGGVGVAESARDDLLAELTLARDGLPLEYDGRGIHVRVSFAGVPARLLVDTGASTTVISVGLAEALGSRARERGVGVQTAGGIVQGELHRVHDLRVGGLHVDELEVLVLERLPAGAEGLLGMDVLGRIPPRVLPMTLLGRPPVSG